MRCPKCEGDALVRNGDEVHCITCGNLMWLKKNTEENVAKLTGSLPAKRAKEIQARKAEIIAAWEELGSIRDCVVRLGISEQSLKKWLPKWVCDIGKDLISGQTDAKVDRIVDPGPPFPVVEDIDYEIRAMRYCHEALKVLGKPEQKRIVFWLKDKLGI